METWRAEEREEDLRAIDRVDGFLGPEFPPCYEKCEHSSFSRWLSRVVEKIVDSRKILVEFSKCLW